MTGAGSSRGTAWTPWVVLLLGWAATAVGVVSVHRSTRERDLVRFEQVVRAAEDRLAARVEVHLGILRGTAGLFASGLAPNVEQFREYVRRIHLSEFYPGVQGVGFTRRIRPEQLDEVVARIRVEAYPEFRVWPETPREEYHAIVLLEPLEQRNRVALGYDMFTEKVRRAAMVRARDNGRAAVSGKVTLVQETDPEKQPGFLIYLPVFERGETPDSVEKRRQALQGFAYSPLRAHDFFQGVFQGEPLLAALAIYDGARIDPQALLFATGEPRSGSFEVVRTFMAADHLWTIRYTSLPAFDAQSNRSLPVVFAGVGVVVTLLFFLLVRLEVQSRRANELAAMLRERLLAIVGHDLRNPLSAITMGTAVLARKEGLDARSRALVQRIEQSAQRMARLISDVLDFARIQQGMALPVELASADVGEVVRHVVDEFRLARPEAALRLEIGGPAPAWVDPDRLAQVVSNLIGNAFKHGKGPVTVRVRAREPELLAIEIHNEGPAISPELMPRLFDPYARGDARAQRGSGGLGLGLYITREIVRGHGGHIEVRSSDREGTTFTVLVPRHAP